MPTSQHILVHPSKTAKSGKFDCTVMSLSLLLDYRQDDSKEHTFEVSLFAELFNEMLMRDFGFNIYKALYRLPDKLKEEKKEKDDKKEKDSEKEDKYKKYDKKKEEKKKSSKIYEKKLEEGQQNQQVNTNVTEDNEKKNKVTEEEQFETEVGDRERKDAHRDNKQQEESDEDECIERKKDRQVNKKDKKEKIKLFTKDKHLLLSFLYFDQTHCGYIFDKDIEDLIYTLGLKLSRAQIRKLVGKVIVRDSLHYRKLTDKPKDDECIIDNSCLTEDQWDEAAIGNKKHMPVFSKNDTKEIDKVEIESSNFQEGQ